MRKAILKVIVFVLFSAGCHLYAQSTQAADVQGSVVDADALGLSDSTLRVTDQLGALIVTARTDANGRFRLQPLPLGSYQITVSHEGFADRTVAADATSTKSVNISVTLVPASNNQTVIVAAERLLEPVTTSSRLGLTPLQTPASLSSLSSSVLSERGFNQVEDAVRTMPGVTAGGTPEAPSQFVVRGFQSNQILTLRDGTYVGPAGMVTRPENSFNLAQIEILSGPSSLLYGQGAIGGIVNEITKPALFVPKQWEAVATYGSFNTYTLAAGAGGELTRSLAFRGDFSAYSTDGFVDGSTAHTINGTGSLFWRPAANLNVRVALDSGADKLPSYYGTPFVPAGFTSVPLKGVVVAGNGSVIDSRMRYKNYDVTDQIGRSLTFLPLVTISWQPTPSLNVVSSTRYFHAERRWSDSETYTFLGPNSGAVDALGRPIPANVIGRDRFTVTHEQNMPGETVSATLMHRLFRLDNRAVAGFDFYHISFTRGHGGPSASYVDWVDPLNPIRGVYGNYPGTSPIPVSPTTITDRAFFFEDALQMTKRLSAVGGLRFESFDLDRLNFSAAGAFQPSTSFARNYHPLNFRGGLVYTVAPYLTVYGQYSTGQDPSGGSNIFLVNASQNFDLSSSSQEEIGLKSVLPHGVGEATLALYSIKRSNILTQTAVDVVSNIGSQKSKGVEFSTTLRPVTHLQVSFNTAYTHAIYGYFLDTGSGTSYTGNHPPNVPVLTSNLWAETQRIGRLPLDFGGGFRFVGERFADNANRNKLLNYTVLDLYGNYHFGERYVFTVRGRNLLDKAYAQWADTTYPTELNLGAPRSFELSFRKIF